MQTLKLTIALCLISSLVQSSAAQTIGPELQITSMGQVILISKNITFSLYDEFSVSYYSNLIRGTSLSLKLTKSSSESDYGDGTWIDVTEDKKGILAIFGDLKAKKVLLIQNMNVEWMDADGFTSKTTLTEATRKRSLVCDNGMDLLCDPMRGDGLEFSIQTRQACPPLSQAAASGIFKLNQAKIDCAQLGGFILTSYKYFKKE